jgi:hypothetical protein
MELAQDCVQWLALVLAENISTLWTKTGRLESIKRNEDILKKLKIKTMTGCIQNYHSKWNMQTEE